MSEVTKNGFSHFRRGFEAFHKSRYPTDFEKISHKCGSMANALPFRSVCYWGIYSIVYLNLRVTWSTSLVAPNIWDLEAAWRFYSHFVLTYSFVLSTCCFLVCMLFYWLSGSSFHFHSFYFHSTSSSRQLLPTPVWVPRWSAAATASEGLAQGPCVFAELYQVFLLLLAAVNIV